MSKVKVAHRVMKRTTGVGMHVDTTACACVRVQAAYKDWLCASLLTGSVGDESSWRCRLYCDRVAQVCPYLLPQIEFSYVGEPAFSCTGAYTRPGGCLQGRSQW